MPVYIPTKDDIICSLEVQLRLKDEHVAHLNEQIAGLREQLADRERLLHLQAERREGEALRADKERLDWLKNKLRDDNAALRDVLERWRRLCEMGLQDVVPAWVAPTVETLWEETDKLVPSSKGGVK